MFEHPFHRIRVTTHAHLIRLVAYIHQNPQKHGFVTDFRDWPYSSYHAHLAKKPTRLKRDEVLAWFEGVERFGRAHRDMIGEQQIAALAPDDFD